MCGIAGFWWAERPSYEPEAVLARMTREIEHRGPDSGGQHVDPTLGLALGHRRLSIVDLSAEGHQPMVSESGRYVVVYNGEIFNYERIRKRLTTRHHFRGHSDTEVLLAAIEEWGLGRAIEESIGMFALALWDNEDRSLTLVRDRLGVKPLYYASFGKTFLFASELKALRCHPGFEARVSPEAVAEYMRYGYVPAPHCIYAGVNKLPPGTLLRVQAPNATDLATTSYWSPQTAAHKGASDPFHGTASEAIKELDTLLTDAVKLRMTADVPLGAFLSGGIDSSTVVALMQANSARPIKTFSIGVDDRELNEAADAARVARHLGTDHVEFIATEKHALEVIPHLPAIYDEPFADSSQIPTYLVSALAKREVTVALSGDGGDEVFGGYNRHVWAPLVYRAARAVPKTVRRVAAIAVGSRSVEFWDRAGDLLQVASQRSKRQAMFGAKLFKVAAALEAETPSEFYESLRSHWHVNESLVVGYEGIRSPSAYSFDGSFAGEMMLKDLASYLPDDILTKVDRSSMAVALEARVPMLDHRVVEFAWRLPMNLKIRGRTGKWILRRVLDKYVPREIVDRPKKGFGVPIGNWLRGPLRDWAEELLSERALKNEGLLSPTPITRMWSHHVQGRGSYAHHLWDALMLQAWSIEQRSALVGPTIRERGLSLGDSSRSINHA